MSTPLVERVHTSETGDETHSLNGHKPEYVASAADKSSTPVTSEEVAGQRQIKAAIDHLTR